MSNHPHRIPATPDQAVKRAAYAARAASQRPPAPEAEPEQPRVIRPGAQRMPMETRLAHYGAPGHRTARQRHRAARKAGARLDAARDTISAAFADAVAGDRAGAYRQIDQLTQDEFELAGGAQAMAAVPAARAALAGADRARRDG